ncbi:unnamed protein product [Triticum turgidum subsp. durum]|uniref:START domain-containing protein n=1 Tax=Triticum turgidum subsp. durum TaxID=4567 RepID=A0A9R0TUG0_TRITD|nr:unnamed protein product [Triticum turgidum subsp. durum]
MNEVRWSEMFPCVVARASTMEIISSGMGGTRSGSIQLMRAELQVLSPLVPIREVTFLRFCKQHADGLWVIVDVSVDGVLRPDSGTGAGPAGYMGCRLLPSGCIGFAFAVVNWASSESPVPPLCSGDIMGDQIRSMQLQAGCCRSWPCLRRAACPLASASERRHLLHARRIYYYFATVRDQLAARPAPRVRRQPPLLPCRGKWPKPAGKAKLHSVRGCPWMMARQSVGAPGEPPGVVLSATTSVRLPGTPPQRVFDYLRDEQRRGEWDILANGEAMQEMDHIAKGQHHGNAVSLLRPNATSGNQNNMLILQETCTDASGSLVVYAPVDVQSMHVVMGGGDSAYVSLLPSGFASPNAHGGSSNNSPGSLVTVAFQILVNNLPTAKLTVESVDTVSNLLSCTIQKIKSALQRK